MKLKRAARDIDEYIGYFSPEVQVILQKIRATVRKAAPHAQETISYQIPAFTLNGQLVYFAAFKNHIGFYPPVIGGDQKFKKAKSAFEGPKGNLQFPLDKPIPYGVIGKLVKLRVKQNLDKARVKRSRK